ncbi:PulJ/GspJ family protein [Planococcus versutus]|uniref:Prepilin-type N-terminal cleavage/methylation domain-containing protein n=1 Tax=Planococcus versutus TaxID=1302659 RepID=A0A1B1RXI9_9BACL|nr:prepilin-type N-terminal cleavage/methylation domain-containing protein [Planococcus versutus]ANU25652.1 hypothetical protein I858_000985 [Planococcus versutus]
MNKIINVFKNDHGVTLVELMATLVIVSIIGILSYTVLFQGYSNYQRIQVETQLRDEADLIMASMIKDLFILKDGQIEVENFCTNNKKTSLLNVMKSGKFVKTGFEGENVLVNGNVINFYNQNVKIIPTDCSSNSPTSITKNDTEAEYTIVFTLKLNKGNKEHRMKFENTVQVIANSKEDAG